jgi:TolB-like protein
VNRAKDITILVLLLAVVYLLVSRDRAVTVSDGLQVPPAAIAVLPFVNVSGDPEIEYLSDSLWIAIINSLAEHPELRLASQTSSSRYKGVATDLRKIGDELGVSYVVEGGIKGTGTAVEITTQLLRTDDGYHVWWDSFQATAESANPLALEISDAVARELGNHLKAQ